MSSRYTIGEKWFMWKALRLSSFYGLLWKFYDWLGWQEKANKAFDKSQDWFERGWECSLGM